MLVSAHTSAGKTVVAEYAFAMALRHGPAERPDLTFSSAAAQRARQRRHLTRPVSPLAFSRAPTAGMASGSCTLPH